MGILLLLGGAVGFGFFLIFLIGATAPKPQPLDLKASSGGSPLVELDAEQLGKVVAVLLDKMGLELDSAKGGNGGIVEIMAVNPAPITGGKILVHCIPAPPQSGRIDGPAVLKFIRSVRSAYVSKGLLFTTGEITPDGRLDAEDAPIELFDRDQLGKLVTEHIGELDDETLARLNRG